MQGTAKNYLAGLLGLGTIIPTSDLSLGGNIPRNIASERHTTANTAGNSLTIRAGGATASATDKASGNLVLAPGISTGIGGGSVKIQGVSKAVSSGSTDNALTDRYVVASPINLTDSVATNVLDIDLAAGTMTGGHIDYSILTSDGIDYQAISGRVNFTAVNKGGTYTINIVATATLSSALSAGTLVDTWSVLNGTNKITIQCSANTSLTPTRMQLFYIYHNGSAQTNTPMGGDRPFGQDQL